MNILTKSQRDKLKAARSRATKVGFEIEVGEYSRVFYRLEGREARLAKLENLERAVEALLKHKERHPKARVAGEERSIQVVVELLHDAYGVVATEE